MTSGRDLLRLGQRDTAEIGKVTAPIVVADPLFRGSRATSTRAGDTGKATRAFDPRVLDRDLQFSPLPGTAQEAAALAKILPEARVFTGASASETLLKQSAAPSILHIATHGFFLQPRSTARAVASSRGSSTGPPDVRSVLDREDALLLSGLALAGANQRSDGGGEDGILTALEVSGLDLWGTRMVVLSACETGLGDARIGEGVYGLRRALVLAGSESQVVSLWKVSDAATRDLMVAYYQRLRAGEGRADALHNVQLAMLQGPRKQAHPFFWAGFIESGDWRALE